MSLNEQRLKDLLHGIVSWLPVANEDVATEFHVLVDNLDNLGDLPVAEPVGVPSAGTVVESPATASNASDQLVAVLQAGFAQLATQNAAILEAVKPSETPAAGAPGA